MTASGSRLRLGPANNILDGEARRSTGLLKDYAPLAGRDLRLGLRFDY